MSLVLHTEVETISLVFGSTHPVPVVADPEDNLLNTKKNSMSLAKHQTYIQYAWTSGTT